MNSDATRTHGFDLMFAIACFIQSSSLLTAFIASLTRQDTWIVVALGALICCPLVWFYAKLIEGFPGKNLFDIFNIVYGKYLGKVLGVLYTLFFLNFTVLNVRDLTLFVRNSILQNTPLLVIAVTFMIVLAWAASSGGLKNIIQYGFMMSMICLVVVIISIILTWNLMDFNNFLPMFDLPPKTYVQGTNIVLAIPFAEIIIFLMVTQDINTKNRSIFFYLLGGVVLGCVTILLVVIRDTAVLGNTMPIFALPAFETLRMVSFAQALSRMEILFAFVLIILLFCKVLWLFYVTVISTAHVLNFKHSRHLVLLIGALAILFSLILFPDDLTHMQLGQKVAPIIWPIFEIVIPILTLGIGKLRKLTQPKSKESSKNKPSYQTQSA